MEDTSTGSEPAERPEPRPDESEAGELFFRGCSTPNAFGHRVRRIGEFYAPEPLARIDG